MLLTLVWSIQGVNMENETAVESIHLERPLSAQTQTVVESIR